MSKPTVYVTRKIALDAITLLKASANIRLWDSEEQCPRKELIENVKDCDGIICTVVDNIDTEVLNAAGKNLKAVSTVSVGVVHINTTECSKRGIQVLNTPDVASDSAAEFTVALTLVTARRLIEGLDAVMTGLWGPWRPMWLCGTEMSGRTIGIMGFGRVGFGVARRLKAFGVGKIIYHDLFSVGYAEQVEAQLVAFDELLKKSDILIITVAATAKTIKIFNKDSFAKMKNGAIFINISRGVIVDHDALAVAITKGKIQRAGLDVTDPEPLPSNHPLMNNRKVVITPHLGTNTWDTRKNMSIAAVDNLLHALGEAGQGSKKKAASSSGFLCC